MPLAKPTGGVVRAGCCYPLAEFGRLTGLGQKSVRRAAREGLPIRRQGRNAYVLGDDWLAYLVSKEGAR